MATKDFSTKQENMIADLLDWDIVSGSGAPAFCVGDVISDKYLGECKTHVERSKKITFKQDVWMKICEEAMVKGRIPVYFTDNGTQRMEDTYCLLKCPFDIDRLPDIFTVRPLKLDIKKQINLDSQKLEKSIHKRSNTIYIIDWIESMILMNLQTFNEYQMYG